MKNRINDILIRYVSLIDLIGQELDTLAGTENKKDYDKKFLAYVKACEKLFDLCAKYQILDTDELRVVLGLDTRRTDDDLSAFIPAEKMWLVEELQNLINERNTQRDT